MDGSKKKRSQIRVSESVSLGLYRTLLYAYPSDFRRYYRAEMVQTFRDCQRAAYEQTRWFGLAGLWLRTVFDLVHSASVEHLENFGKEGELMNNLGRQLLAVLGCIAIIIAALSLLTYGRKHEVASILFFGYALDAIVVAGVIGNLIVFLLVKTTRFNPLRTALWTFLTVTSLMLLTSVLLGIFVGPFYFAPVLIGHAVSFFFWLGVHWLWSRGHSEPQTA